MRKFTKEITSLIASAAVGTAAGVGAFAAAPEGTIQTSGAEIIPTDIPCPTEIWTTAGVPMISDEFVEIPTEEIPPLAGEPLPPDEFIEPTTEEMPPLGGVDMPPNEFIETPTEEDIPPLAGDIAPPDGDVNGDGSLSVADVVSLQKWLLNAPYAELDNWRAADLYNDGKLDVFDLTLMKKALIEKMGDVSEASQSFKVYDDE